MVNSTQMQGIENLILSSGMPQEALMEKIGKTMSTWMLERFKLTDRKVIVFVGPGHNGGDGLVLAKELHYSGVNVSLWTPFPLKKKLTQNHFSHAIWLGIKCQKEAPDPFRNELWVDALFGLNQKRGLSEELALLFQTRFENTRAPVISLDIPSGICSDTGIPISGNAVRADFTVTVGLLKIGLLQDSAKEYVGRIKRIDMGIPEKLISQNLKKAPLRITFSDICEDQLPITNPSLEKYQRGRVLAVAGSSKYRGAFFLALKGLLASGVGSIQAAIPESIKDFYSQSLPEIVSAGLLKQSPDGSSLINDFFENTLLNKLDALLVGPGLGVSNENWDLISNKLLDFEGLLVLDADGLNRLSKSIEGSKWLARRKFPTLLTPHKKEFERLFPDFDKTNILQSVIEASNRTGTAILLKGAHSIFSTPEANVWQIGESAPWVARAGLGDVLAGFLAGYGAMAFSVSGQLNWEYLAHATLIHAESAKICPFGSTASSISEFLGEFNNRLMRKKYLERDI